MAIAATQSFIFSRRDILMTTVRKFAKHIARITHRHGSRVRGVYAAYHRIFPGRRNRCYSSREFNTILRCEISRIYRVDGTVSGLGGKPPLPRVV